MPSFTHLPKHLTIDQLVLSALLILSVGLNCLLATRVSQARKAVEATKHEGRLEVGAKVLAVSGTLLDGSHSILTYPASKPTVLYVFSPQCTWCERNSKSFASLASQIGSSYRVVGVSLSTNGLKKYVAEHKMSIPVYAAVDPSVSTGYKLSGTPETIVISADGRVMRAWFGAFTKNQKEEVERFFKATLPELPSPSE